MATKYTMDCTSGQRKSVAENKKQSKKEPLKCMTEICNNFYGFKRVYIPLSIQKNLAFLNAYCIPETYQGGIHWCLDTSHIVLRI